MERKTVNVYAPVKSILLDMKKHLKLSNESEVIAYLYSLYDQRYKNLTMIEHETAIQKMNDIHNQGTL